MFDVKRRDFITLLGGAAAWPFAARGQQPDRVRRIGVLMSFQESDSEAQTWATAFRRRLHELGWIDGRTVRIEYRWAAGDVDRMQKFAKELVGLAPDVILAVTSPATASLLRETRTIPVVFTVVSDPVGSGFVENLPRPGGNATGFINIEASLGGKWMELLKEVAPHVSRAAFMFNPKTAPYARYYLLPFQSAAASFGVESFGAAISDAAQIENVIASLGREASSGLIVMPDTSIQLHRELIISLVARLRVPTVYPFRFFVTGGGLISYGVDLVDLNRRAASYVDRILQGTKPSDLPVEAPTKFEMAINLRTAKALGLDVPPTLLATADEVIE